MIETFENLAYCENFRDDLLKINDDRKIKMTLSDFTDPETLILMTVRVSDSKKTKTNHYK
jgi:hypothetical protein